MENVSLHHSLMHLPMSSQTRHALLVRYYRGQKELPNTRQLPHRLARLTVQSSSPTRLPR